ncbi:MAG: DUF167 domain-containing protein [Chloroflexota bacterium]
MPIPENKTIISVRVYPNANKNEVVSFISDILRIRISAPPVNGKANKELIAFLSRLFGISKDSVSIIKGHTNRNKLISIDGLSQDSISKLLFPDKDK